jgi:hypothetical protein
VKAICSWQESGQLNNVTLEGIFSRIHGIHCSLKFSTIESKINFYIRKDFQNYQHGCEPGHPFCLCSRYQGQGGASRVDPAE